MASLDQNINGVYSVISNTRAYPQIIATQLAQNTSTNKSQIRVIFRVQRPNTAWYVAGYYDHTPYVESSLGWRSQWVNFAQYSNSVETVLTYDSWITHNADGTGSLNLWWTGDLGTGWGTHDFGVTVTLNTITRASTVTTGSTTSITSSSAITNGNVTDAGIPANTDKGIYWGTSSSSQPYKISAGSGGAGAYTVSMSSLSPNTTYYYKAYTYNARYGTIFGSVANFTTSAIAPALTTSAVSAIYSNKATANGNITDVYGANATRRGFCYMVGTTGDPTTSNSVVYDDGDFGTGTFSKVITGLTASTNYRVRPYAVNSAGTGYGTTVQLTTLTDEHSLTFSDTMAVQESYNLRKALKMDGVIQVGTLGGWYVGANYWAGNFVREKVEYFVDSLKVGDSFTTIKEYVRNLIESIILSEIFTNKFIVVLSLIDYISVRSGLQRVYDIAKGWVESIHIVDNITKAVERFIGDVIHLVDSFLATILRLLTRTFVDSIHIIDNFISNMGRYFTDSIQIGENWIKTFVIFLGEVIHIDDLLSEFQKDYIRLWQETITLSQNISKHVIILVTSILSIFDGEFTRKLNGQLIAWAKEIRRIVDWIKRGKDEGTYIQVERKLNDWEVREKDLGLYESKVKPLEEWTKLRKQK